MLRFRPRVSREDGNQYMEPIHPLSRIVQRLNPCTLLVTIPLKIDSFTCDFFETVPGRGCSYVTPHLELSDGIVKLQIIHPCIVSPNS